MKNISPYRISGETLHLSFIPISSYHPPHGVRLPRSGAGLGIICVWKIRMPVLPSRIHFVIFTLCRRHYLIMKHPNQMSCNGKRHHSWLTYFDQYIKLHAPQIWIIAFHKCVFSAANWMISTVTSKTFVNTPYIQRERKTYHKKIF